MYFFFKIIIKKPYIIILAMLLFCTQLNANLPYFLDLTRGECIVYNIIKILA